MYGYEHVGMGWGGLWMVLIWAIPILLVVLLVRYFTRDSGGKAVKSALDILDARYARGGIGRDEYLKRRADLSQ
jgi:putative membrane protein